ncbi:MAG: hypothetical protein ACTHK2_07890 [Dokdonella sp.]|uniref:hypothetical protein n=1 Tax=Dokdonella sp. TaxID=2291710 RepID=UPI003F80886D
MDLHDVRVAVTPDDLARVGAFRYRIYVEEQRKFAAHADHEARTLIEPLDRKASSLVYTIERRRDRSDDACRVPRRGCARAPCRRVGRSAARSTARTSTFAHVPASVLLGGVAQLQSACRLDSSAPGR